jgi:hypothetical protein
MNTWLANERLADAIQLKLNKQTKSLGFTREVKQNNLTILTVDQNIGISVTRDGHIFGATTLSMTTFSITTFSITTFSITTLSITINKMWHSAL